MSTSATTVDELRRQLIGASIGDPTALLDFTGDLVRELVAADALDGLVHVIAALALDAATALAFEDVIAGNDAPSASDRVRRRLLEQQAISTSIDGGPHGSHHR